MWKNIKYLFLCLFSVIILSGLLSVLASREFIFNKDMWSTIATFGGFSLSLCGIILTVLLYNYITYEDVQKNVHGELYLSKKGLQELVSDLHSFVNKLGNNQGFLKEDLSKEINTIKYFFNMAEVNPKSILFPCKKDLSKLVSGINRSGLGKKNNDEISNDTRRKLKDEAFTCIRSIEIINISYNENLTRK